MNVKKIFFIVIISTFLIINGHTAIKDALFATVGHKAITQSDIVKEIKIILILSGQSFSVDKREQLQEIAIKSAVKRNIKKIEIEKHNTLEFDPVDLQNELLRAAKRALMELDLLKKTLIENGIEFSEIKDHIKTELLWNSLIFKLYKDRLSINIDEINEQLKLIQDKKIIEEYLISEIIIKPVTNDKLKTKIEELKNRIKIEGFEKVAIDSSISETSIRGGDLGWVEENTIPEKFKSKIISTPVGEVSEPIILTEGVLIFKIRNKRVSENIFDLESAKKQIVNAEKTKMLNMHSLSHYNNLRRSISVNYFVKK